MNRKFVCTILAVNKPLSQQNVLLYPTCSFSRSLQLSTFFRNPPTFTKPKYRTIHIKLHLLMRHLVYIVTFPVVFFRNPPTFTKPKNRTIHIKLHLLMRHLVYIVTFPVVSINSSLLTITPNSSIIIISVYKLRH